MTATGVRTDPQGRLGERVVDDAEMLRLLEERETAKAAYDDARSELADYIEASFQEGEFRCGRFKLRVGSRLSISITIPKTKAGRRP